MDLVLAQLLASTRHADIMASAGEERRGPRDREREGETERDTEREIEKNMGT